MVLYQIEESLGSFVIENGNIERLSAESVENIHKREVDKGRIFNKDSIKDIVESTYLDEIFRFALDITSDSSSRDSVNYLYSLFHQLDIYEIRNAISHPNRPFWDCYWYRVASIASDPVNEILGLGEIKEVLVAAESGRIEDPPEEWKDKIIWQIPNNLPDQFDHGLTGLIGRTKELADLRKYISNPRVNTIAVVAPGGAGKTALALDLLHQIVSTPSFTKYVDCVLYVTMKTERLTWEGIVELDSIETISELRHSILDSLNFIYDENQDDFLKILELNKDKKVLLCIDNLETLLRDDPNSFDELNQSLPGTWQVLVTSRVAVSNATILTVDALKESSAVHLARTYHTKRGGESLEEAEYVKLTKGCFYNPLAIRLTLDLILTGKDVPSAINVANKEIAEFSYNNLISALSEDSIEVLEAVFVEDLSTRLSLCDLLDKTLDEISPAVGELSKTSLISRRLTDQGESYSLSDSVRDLLLISPRNISIRTHVQELINKRRVLSKDIDIKQDQKDMPEWHYDFIPKDTNENLKILLTKVNKKLLVAKKDTSEAVSLFKELKAAKFLYDNSAIYHRAFGRVIEILKDFNSAEQHYNHAISLDSNPSSRSLLARLFHNTKRYEEASEVYLQLIKDGWVSEVAGNIPFGKAIYNGLFLALLYSGKYDEILDHTKKWHDSDVYRGILGVYRASAWKRKMESYVNDDHRITVDYLLKATTILDDVFRHDGYFPVANIQSINIFEEIEYCFTRVDYSSQFDLEGKKLLDFINKHYYEIYNSKSDRRATFLKKLSVIQVTGNPFSKNNYLDDYSDQELTYLEDSDLVSVKISNRPKDNIKYLFARDKNNQNYFLHFDYFRGGDWKMWLQLSKGDELAVRADFDHQINGKAINVKDIYAMNDLRV